MKNRQPLKTKHTDLTQKCSGLYIKEIGQPGNIWEIQSTRAKKLINIHKRNTHKIR